MYNKLAEVIKLDQYSWWFVITLEKSIKIKTAATRSAIGWRIIHESSFSRFNVKLKFIPKANEPQKCQ